MTRLIVIWLTLVLLVACAGSNVVDAPTASPTASAGDAPVTLVLWYGWSGANRQALTLLVDRFNKQHPAGRVLAQAMPLTTMSGDLRAAAAAGSGPHLILLPNTWIGGLAQERVLLPLDDLISPAEREPLLPVAVGGAQATDADGKQRLYGLPVSFDTLALFYNKANVLAAPETTDAMLQLARGLSTPTANPPLWGLGLNLSLDNVIGYLYAFGGRIFDERGELVLGGTGRAGTEQWLGWLSKINADQQVMAHTDSGLEVDRALKNGHIVMSFGWAHQIDDYRRLWGDQMGIAPLPRLSETNQPPQPYVQSDVLAINGRVGERERRAAVEFLHFMIAEEAQRTLLDNNIQPARQDLRLDGDAGALVAARVFRAQGQQGQPMPNAPDRDVVRQGLRIMQQQALSGSTTPPRDAVTQTEEWLRKALKPTK